MKLSIPETLKLLLVDDWEAITKNNQVCSFPPFTLLPIVTSILTGMHITTSSLLFLEHQTCRKSWNNSASISSRNRQQCAYASCRILHIWDLDVLWYRLRDPKTLLPTITAGLQTYFDRALGANLLYRFERPQYAEVRKQYVTGPNVKVGQEKEMSAIYGAEHLLRMLGACRYIGCSDHFWWTCTTTVNLPQMVMSSAMDSESVGLVRDYVNELML